jgi:hypothetical protein
MFFRLVVEGTIYAEERSIFHCYRLDMIKSGVSKMAELRHITRTAYFFPFFFHIGNGSTAVTHVFLFILEKETYSGGATVNYTPLSRVRAKGAFSLSRDTYPHPLF